MRRPPFATDKAMVGGLAVSVSVAYGALFYAFSVLITDDGAGSVFSTSLLSLAFGGSVLSGAAAAPAVGRLADRHGVRRITLAGAVFGGLGLAAFAVSDEPWQVIVIWWVALGPAAAMTFYEPAYVAINQWCPPEQRTNAIALLTLAGGLSGPVSIPATTELVELLGWRSATLVLAAMFASALALVALLALRGAPAQERSGPEGARSRAPAGLFRTRRFVVFTSASVLIYGALEATVLHRIARFERAGFDLSVAALWAAIAGLVSLPGRFFLPRLAARRSATGLLAGVAVVLGVATTLAVQPTTDASLVGHFLLFGVVLGAALPLRAVAMSQWYSGPNFGRIMGVQAASIGVARAGWPVLIGATRQHLGEPAAMAAVAVAFVAGAVLVTLSEPRSSGAQPGSPIATGGEPS